MKEKASEPNKTKVKEKASEPIQTKVKEKISEPNKTKVKRKAKGVRTYIRRLKQEKSNDTLIATPKKNVLPKITQAKE